MFPPSKNKKCLIKFELVMLQTMPTSKLQRRLGHQPDLNRKQPRALIRGCFSDRLGSA